MLNIRDLLIFSSMLFIARCFKPDCEANNQFRYSCFSIEHCNKGKCETNWCGYHFNSTLVKITQANILPKCAFADAPFLKQVIGRGLKIQIVASGAFINLPSLETIDLSLNEISTLHTETFKNVAATSLDLSWNKIKYIQEGAFSGLPNLQHLNLSRNELQTFPVHQLPKKVVNINLSHNLFTRFVLSSNRAPSLVSLNLSHNKLSKLALQFENLLKKIDISTNELTAIDYTDVSYCEEVKINSNRFSTVPDLLTISSLKQAGISPNPWKCDELEKIWPILSMNSVKLLDDGGETEAQPVCGDIDFQSRYVFGSQKLSRYCEADAECDQEEICRSNTCVNPCNENICDSSRTCAMFSHYLSCDCKENWKKDPENPLGPCQNVECFTTLDCFRPSTYCQNNTCILIPGADTQQSDLPPSIPDTLSRGYSSISSYSSPIGDFGSAPTEIMNIAEQQALADGKKWWEFDI